MVDQYAQDLGCCLPAWSCPRLVCQVKHTEEGRQCWCEPRLEEFPSGFMVSHDDVTWIGKWETLELEDGDIIVKPADSEGNP